MFFIAITSHINNKMEYLMFGENLLIKFWDTLTKEGIGSLASPWQIKREGKAHVDVRRHEMLTMAQTEIDAQQIKEGTKKLLPNGTVEHIDNKDHDESNLNLKNVSLKIEQQEKATKIQQEIHVNKTIHLAEKELLRSKQNPSDKDVDPDWILRWHEYAKNLKNEDLRQIWAKTLAGEVTSPGSYSLRTLEFIKNLSQEEALAISKLGQFLLKGVIFQCSTLEKEGIDFNFLLQMDELGILNGVQGGFGDLSAIELVMTSQENNKYSTTLINKNLALLIQAEDPNKELTLSCYQTSKIGAELLSLGDFKPNKKYMIELGQKIKAKGFDVEIASWEQTHADRGQYSNPQPIN